MGPVLLNRVMAGVTKEGLLVTGHMAMSYQVPVGSWGSRPRGQVHGEGRVTARMQDLLRAMQSGLAGSGCRAQDAGGEG